MNELFSEEKRSPENCLKPEKWQTPPHINKAELKLLFFEVSLFIPFIETGKLSKFVYQVCLGRTKNKIK